MEYTENLKAWLRFNDSTTADVCGNSWAATGNPSVSAQNAKNGNALQLDGSSHIKLSGLPLCGQAFTIDLWVYANSSTPSNGRVISIINPATGHMLFSLRRRSTTAANSAQLEIYSATNKDAAQDSGSTTTLGVNTTLNNLIHFALVYTGTGNQARVYINGSRAYINTAVHSRLNCDIVVGAKTDNTQGLIGTIDELRIYDGVQLYNNSFTPPSASEYNGFDFFFDAQRKVINPPLTWFYKNPGRADLLTTANGTTVTGLTADQSKTGVGFYQPDRTACFGISATKEIWIRCDAYTTANYANNDRLRIYSDDSNGINGWATNPTITNNTSIWHNGTGTTTTNIDYFGWPRNRSILLHMRSGSSDGLIEISLKNLTTGVILTDTYTGNVNAGNDFANVYIQMDGANIYVSNLIISNVELTFETSYIYPAFDVIRMPKIPATLWQYENAGTITDLINTNTAVQVDNLPQTQSKTGVAFYQTTENIALFDIATNTPEIWIKFDVYSQGYGWDVQDYTFYQEDSVKVVGIMSLLHFVPNSYIRFFNYDGNVFGSIADVELSAEIDDTLRTFILHMKADSTNGIIELFSDIEGLIYFFSGAVNGGTPFSKIDFVSDVDNGKADLFSNVVISNNPLWFYDNVSADISINFLADAQREILKSLLLSIDAEREIVGGSIQQNFYADIERILAINTSLSADTERDICADLSVNFDAERRLGNAVVVYFDAQRNLTDEEIWRYENVGLLYGLQNVAIPRQYYNLPASKSTTGVAFSQCEKVKGTFPIPETNRFWIKFDVYRENGDAQWTVKDDYSSRFSTVIRTDFWDTDDIDINNTMAAGGSSAIATLEDVAKTDGLQTFILHLEADDTDGIIEVYTDDGGLIYSYSGPVHVGMPFKNIVLNTSYLLESAPYALFSNIVISNGRLDFTDNAHWPDVPVTLDIDTQRVLTAQANYTIDAQRIVCSNSINVDLQVDAERYLDDYNKNITETYSAERVILNTVEIPIDIQRNIVRNIVVPVYVPPEYDPPSHDAPVFPRPEDNSVIQSCTISMQEQQLTDNISFVYAAHVNIMDAVNLQFLDYIIRGRVEETTTKGVLESCHLTCDVDEILYRQLAYEVPENKFEWTAEYLAEINRYNATHEEQVEKIPSAPASAHITEIASKLGKNVSLQFTDFISTMSTTVQSGTNYSGLISELFGWTSRIPHLMINVYMRNETIYVIQRGQEQNTIVLDNAKLAEPTIKRKLMRMTWGSDPWSKTEVVSRMKEWSEFDQSPYNPPEESGESGGGASYGDDNLIEETTVEHGEETVVTTYEYLEMGDGQKFLHKETAKTYSGGELVDTVVTTHEPVSYTQAHVYSTDDDGVIGGVVTNSNFDDRITPYQQEQIAGGGMYGHSDGMVVHDKDGNQYLLYGIAHHQDKEQIGNRTINGVTLIDTSFPVDGEAMLKALTDAIIWLDRKTEESITVDVYDYPHVIDFNNKISLGGNIYFLRSNTVMINEKIRNKQTIEIVRWY